MPINVVKNCCFNVVNEVDRQSMNRNVFLLTLGERTQSKSGFERDLNSKPPRLESDVKYS